MTSVIISQPRYLPFWVYLQRLHHSDIFVFLDNVQRQYLGFENRNKILLSSTPKWLSIPILSSRKEIISKSYIQGESWIEEHKRKISQCYKKHPFFDFYYLEKYYEGAVATLEEKNFSYAETLIKLIDNLVKIFELKANVIKASELNIPASKGVTNLFNICQATGASVYISGANGRNYGVKEYFENRGKKVLFHNPVNYSYTQFGNTSEFIPFLSFFDPLYNLGYNQLRSWVIEPLNLSDS